MKYVLYHEAGHAIGLCRNLSHGDGMHCSNPECLMQSKLLVNEARALAGLEPMTHQQLCHDCLSDITRYRNARSAANLHFMGPYLVRSEEKYHVLSLPNFLYLHVGDLEDLDQKQVAKAYAIALTKRNASEAHGYVSAISSADVPTVYFDMSRDPYELVRSLAEQMRLSYRDMRARRRRR